MRSRRNGRADAPKPFHSSRKREHQKQGEVGLPVFFRVGPPGCGRRRRRRRRRDTNGGPFLNPIPRVHRAIIPQVEVHFVIVLVFLIHLTIEAPILFHTRPRAAIILVRRSVRKGRRGRRRDVGGLYCRFVIVIAAGVVRIMLVTSVGAEKSTDRSAKRSSSKFSGSVIASAIVASVCQ